MPVSARTSQRDSRVAHASRSLAEALERRLLLSTTIAAPTHLVAGNDGFLDASLSWEEVPGASGYVVEQAIADTARFTAVDHPLSANAVEAGLAPLTSYAFRVRAVAQDGTISAPSTVVTIFVPLQQPEITNYTAVSPSRIDLTWDLADGPPSSTEIDRSGDGVHWARLALVPPGRQRYSDTSVSEGTGYYYELRAVDGEFRSDWNGPVGVLTPPAAPVGLTARAVNTGEVDLSWRNVSRTAQGIEVYRLDVGGGIGGVLAPNSTYRDTGLAPGQTYKYYVGSYISSNPISELEVDSSPSNIVTVTTPPASVIGLSATPVSPGGIDLSWTGTTRGATGIEVDLSSDGRTYRRVATLPASARSYRSTGLSSNSHYWYEVRALSPAGPGAFTPIDAYTLVPAPFDLRARLDGLMHFEITWRSDDPPGTVFEIQESIGEPDFVPSALTTTDTSYYDMFGQAGETRWFRIVALNAHQDPSAPSNVVSITSPSPWPGTPDVTFGQGGDAGELFPGADGADAVAIAADGRIVAAGVADGNGTLAVARYNADGTLDPSFAADGRLLTNWHFLQSLLVQGDGKVVVSGEDDAGRLVVARYLVSGAPDATFGRGGVVVFSTVNASAGTAAALQADGKLVVAGIVTQGSTYSYSVMRLTAAGIPDPTFGSGGTTLTPSGGSVPADGSAYGVDAVLVVADGKIVVAGAESIVRYTSSGRLDTSWGIGGFVRGFSLFVTDAIAQPDGKLLVSSGEGVTRLLSNGKPDPTYGDQGTSDASGSAQFVPGPGGTILVTHFSPLLTALTPTGKLDAAFGSEGGVDVPDTMFAYGAARQPDGRIVVVGGVGPDSPAPPGFMVVRYLPNGSLDPSFGYFGLSQVPEGLSGGVDAVALQRDGKVLAAGKEVNPDPNLPNEAGIVRYNPDGTLDTTFGQNGHAYLRIGHDAVFSTMAVAPNGDIVVGGSGEVRGVKVFVVARFLPSGFVDSRFGTNGVVISTFGHSPTQQCTSLAVQGNGDIVAVGSTDHQLVVERLLPSGALDSHFGTAGVVLLNPGGKPASAGAMALQTDGRIVIGGTLNGNFGVIRLTPNGAFDRTFGSGGVVRTVIAGGSSATALVLDRQGRMVVGGASGAAGLPTFARYLSNGRLDTTFGAGGIMRFTSATGETVTNLAVDLRGRLVALVATPYGAVAVRLTDRGPDPEFSDATLRTPANLPSGGLAIDSSGKILAGALGLWRLND